MPFKYSFQGKISKNKDSILKIALNLTLLRL